MIGGKTVAVVVPAYDEEALIADTIAGIPTFVDRIIVVDDASRDATAERARGFADPQIEVIVHERNRGVGAAIVTGYQRALAERVEVTRRNGRATTRWTRTSSSGCSSPCSAARSTTRMRTG